MGTGGLDVSVPTLFLSECVLVYLEPEESGAVIAWAGATFPSAAFLTYEQVAGSPIASCACIVTDATVFCGRWPVNQPARWYLSMTTFVGTMSCRSNDRLICSMLWRIVGICCFLAIITPCMPWEVVMTLHSLRYTRTMRSVR